jgi:hypothetical protein
MAFRALGINGAISKVPSAPSGFWATIVDLARRYPGSVGVHIGCGMTRNACSVGISNIRNGQKWSILQLLV